MIEKLNEVLKEETRGMSQIEKLKYIQNLGFPTYADIMKLNKYEMEDLITHIRGERPKVFADGKIPRDDGYIECDNGYLVRRGESAADCGFMLPEKYRK